MAASEKKLSKRQSSAVSRSRTQETDTASRKDAPNPIWFKPVMFGFMLLGLVWIVLYYVTSMNLQLPIPVLGQANIFVGFGLVLIGFLMTPWWK